MTALVLWFVILFHHALLKVSSVLVLLSTLEVILVCWFVGRPNRLLATVVACPVSLHSALLYRGYSQRIEVVDCTLGLTFYSSSELFSVTKLTFLDS